MKKIGWRCGFDSGDNGYIEVSERKGGAEMKWISKAW